MSQAISLPTSFDPYQITLCLAATVYTSLFVMVSNHFVFKPKIQQLFAHSSIHSPALYQFLIDMLTNLTQLTFVLASILLFSDDNSLSVLVYSDMSWTGLLLCLLSFRAVAAREQPNSRLLTLKNVIFLILGYLSVSLHYLSQQFLISIGLFFVFLYFLNLFINANEDKFVASMETLFGYKPAFEIEQEYNHSNNLPSPEYLSRQFPVSPIDIDNHITQHFPKLKLISLNTKRNMVHNLLKITLAVHLSKNMLEQKAKRDIRYYFGIFNRTLIEKSTKLILEKGNTHHEHEQQPQMILDRQPQDVESPNSALFCLFPVRLFENNRVLSAIFSVAINLGLGLLLSLCLRMTQTIRYGQCFQLLYGLLLLPILPAVSKQQFLSSMTLSAMWKYCLYGIFLSVSCLSSSAVSSFSFTSNTQLVFAPLLQTVALGLSAKFVLQSSSSPYSFLFIWLLALVNSALLIFKTY